MEIIAGIVVGTIASLVVGIWATRKNTAQAVQELPTPTTTDTTVPLQKRLRDAIYDCERQQLQCDNQIDLLCKQLLDLLQDVGRVSHVGVKDKPLFFAYHHPLTNERRYYYERDLSTEMDPSALAQTQRLADAENIQAVAIDRSVEAVLEAQMAIVLRLRRST